MGYSLGLQPIDPNHLLTSWDIQVECHLIWSDFGVISFPNLEDGLPGRLGKYTLEDERLEPTNHPWKERKMIWTKPPGNYVPCESSGV